MSRVPIVIPSYEPDYHLLQLCDALIQDEMTDIVIVDDGSGEEFADIFKTAQEKYHCVVLRHAVNLGKGRGLKSAFNYLLNTYDDIVGCVTADSDGQHTPEDIKKCIDALRETPKKLILGCRDFTGKDIPFKSKFGNVLTQKICRFLCGINVTDTQTGLRGISKEFMEYLLNVPGERFEFETNMLIGTKDNCEIREVAIETVYESTTDHKTHFDPIKDSVRIYRIFGGLFLKYILSSVSSFVIDILLFSMLCSLFKTDDSMFYVTAATIVARVFSASYNYLINYKIVFHSKKQHTKSMVKYFALAVVQMALSALLVTGGAYLLYMIPEVYIKIVVDSVLFLFSYYIQRKFVY